MIRSVCSVNDFFSVVWNRNVMCWVWNAYRVSLGIYKSRATVTHLQCVSHTSMRDNRIIISSNKFRQIWCDLFNIDHLYTVSVCSNPNRIAGQIEWRLFFLPEENIEQVGWLMYKSGFFILNCRHLYSRSSVESQLNHYHPLRSMIDVILILLNRSIGNLFDIDTPRILREFYLSFRDSWHFGAASTRNDDCYPIWLCKPNGFESILSNWIF